MSPCEVLNNAFKFLYYSRVSSAWTTDTQYYFAIMAEAFNGICFEWTLNLFATAPQWPQFNLSLACHLIWSTKLRSQPTHEINLLMRLGQDFSVAQYPSRQLHRCELPKSDYRITQSSRSLWALFFFFRLLFFDC
jgi:hypothetical protein